jgi:iron-sulfur cluster assembly accessory protein
VVESTERAIDLSESAAAQIARLVAKEPNPNAKLRISVDGGGCSGFQYKFDFVNNAESDDLVLEKNGAIVLIDPMSQGFMQGAVIDYVKTMAAEHFEIKNPNATAKCGCGNSFAV